MTAFPHLNNCNNHNVKVTVFPHLNNYNNHNVKVTCLMLLSYQYQFMINFTIEKYWMPVFNTVSVLLDECAVLVLCRTRCLKRKTSGHCQSARQSRRRRWTRSWWTWTWHRWNLNSAPPCFNATHWSTTMMAAARGKLTLMSNNQSQVSHHSLMSFNLPRRSN